MRPRAVAVGALLLVPLAVSGCSIPSWMPLIGKSKPPAPVAEAPPPTRDRP